MTPISIEWVAAVLFAVALAHTFAAKFFERLSHRYPEHTGLFHLLGEVEVVFGFWAIVLIVCMALLQTARKRWPMPSRASTPSPCLCLW